MKSVRNALVLLACTAIAVWGSLVYPGPLGLVTAILGWWLLLIAIVDAEHFWLPDRFTIPLGVFGLVAITAMGQQRVLDHVIGAAAGFLILWMVAAGYRRLRGKEGMGGGDPKLLAAAGMWVGWIGLPSVLLWAAASGLGVVGAKAILKKRLTLDECVPFGTYLALGIWLTWLYGPIGGRF